MAASSKPLATRKQMGRSAMTNGKVLHSNAAGIDGRGHGARRFRDLIAAFSEGMGDLSEADRALIRNAATLTLKMELLQADLVAGLPVDADQLIRLAGTSKRALAAVIAKGADKKPAVPTMADYWASKAAQHDDNEPEVEGEDASDETES
jgi:hypothetical protein